MSANQLISFQLITCWSYCIFQRKIDINFLGHYQANQNFDFLTHHLGPLPRSVKLSSATPPFGLPAPLVKSSCALFSSEPSWVLVIWFISSQVLHSSSSLLSEGLLSIYHQPILTFVEFQSCPGSHWAVQLSYLTSVLALLASGPGTQSFYFSRCSFSSNSSPTRIQSSQLQTWSY